MDEIEKLLRKVQKRDRERLLEALEALRSGQIQGLIIKKLTSSSLYRVRVGDFRIKFSIDRLNKTIKIISVERRGENTYK